MRMLIKTDGTRHELTGPTSMRDITQMIGADGLDTVTLRSPGYAGHVMLVDDHGYETRADINGRVVTLVPVIARKPVNAEATQLYLAQCKPGTMHQIVGDVVVVPDLDFAE